MATLTALTGIVSLTPIKYSYDPWSDGLKTPDLSENTQKYDVSNDTTHIPQGWEKGKLLGNGTFGEVYEVVLPPVDANKPLGAGSLVASRRASIAQSSGATTPAAATTPQPQDIVPPPPPVSSDNSSPNAAADVAAVGGASPTKGEGAATVRQPAPPLDRPQSAVSTASHNSSTTPSTTAAAAAMTTKTSAPAIVVPIEKVRDRLALRVVEDGGPDPQMPMAVKILPLDNQGAVDHEIYVMRKLNHRNIVRYFGHEKQKTTGYAYVFMERCKGSLRTPYPQEEAVDILRQVIDAVAYLHQHNIVHRDIKPGNVLIGRDGKMKLADFGTAAEARMPNLKGTAGTLRFMAPEVLDGSNYGKPCDIWSIGILLLELLGKLPPESDVALPSCLDDDWKTVELPTGLDADIESFCHLCIQMDPKQRREADRLLGHRLFQAQTVETETDVHQSRESSSFLSPLLPCVGTLRTGKQAH